MRNLQEILIQSGIPFAGDRIKIPDWTRRIKLDVGLSYNAPMTQQWVATESDLLVFGFEPDPYSLQALLATENPRRLPGHGMPLEFKYLHDRVFVVPVALGSKNSEIDFYLTEGGGCSSVFQPKESFRSVKEVVKVPLFKLSDFFDLLPWDELTNRGIEYIEYIKIDAQGNDLEIVKGMGNYISKLVYITLESESSTYHQCDGNNFNSIMEYLQAKGFSKLRHCNTVDHTFINNNYLHLADKIYIYQNG